MNNDGAAANSFQGIRVVYDYTHVILTTVNPVEMGLKDHEPILQIVRPDPEYVKAFKTVFNKSGDQITLLCSDMSGYTSFSCV